jgi:deoxycytidylate deaminase
MPDIKYPYLPEGKIIEYVPESHRFMAYARIVAWCDSLDPTMPGAAVIIKDGLIVGAGANGSDYHEKNGCERVRLNCKTGEGYELCEGCHPKNHSEPQAIQSARENGADIRGANLYLWGHWWFCKWCWDAMLEAGISRFFLLERSEVLFNREHPDNIVGKQFPVTPE